MSDFIQTDVFQNLFRNYKKWISENPETTSQFESSLKLLSWFITANSTLNTTLISELMYSLSKLLTLFNDRIIYNSIVITNKKSIDINNKFKIWLTVLEYSEIFIELSLLKLFGQKGKWLAIVTIQIIKSIARLYLLKNDGQLIVKSRQIEPLDRSNLDELIRNQESNGNANVASTSSDIVLSSGIVIRSIHNSASIQERNWKPLKKMNIMSESIQRKLYYTEVLYITKPLLHLTTIAITGQYKWMPWLTSFLLDLHCLHTYNKHCSYLSRTQQLETTRRLLILIFYLLKSPFYEKYTRLKLEKYLLTWSDTILINKIVLPLIKNIEEWQKIYFYFWSM